MLSGRTAAVVCVTGVSILTLPRCTRTLRVLYPSLSSRQEPSPPPNFCRRFQVRRRLTKRRGPPDQRDFARRQTSLTRCRSRTDSPEGAPRLRPYRTAWLG